MALRLFGYLPQSEGEIELLMDNAKRYSRQAHRGGTADARAVLMPYQHKLRALVWAARMKLGTIFCRPNPRDWDKRAYGLFLALQNNLGRLPRVWFLTISFAGNPTYEAVRKKVRGLTKNPLYRAGFETVDVISFHPTPGEPSRLHAHLILWSRCDRTPQAEMRAIDSVVEGLRRAALPKKKKKKKKNETCLIGRCEIERLRDRRSMLNVFAYVAFNYHQTLSLDRGPHNPIPPRARLLSQPQQVTEGRRWTKTGRFAYVTPESVAWRRAVARHAEATGRTADGDWRWIWRERRRIRHFLDPVQYRPPSIAGLDGFTYIVQPYGEDAVGRECYLVTSEDRGSFILTDVGLRGLGIMHAMPNCWPRNDLLDITTGEHACWFEVLGMPIPDWRTRAGEARRPRVRRRIIPRTGR